MRRKIRNPHSLQKGSRQYHKKAARSCMAGGVSEAIALGLFCKLEIFIPESHFDALREALRRVDAGHIGRYDCCLSYSRVMSCWRPLAGTSPFLGKEGELSCEPELKVETVCRTDHLQETLDAVRAVHPYEEPVINALPLLATGLQTSVEKEEKCP